MENVFKKNDLIRAVAAETGITQKEVAEVVDALYKAIAAALKDGKTVRISEVGSLYTKDIPEREHFNISTKGMTVKPAHRALRFVAAETMKKFLYESPSV